MDIKKIAILVVSVLCGAGLAGVALVFALKARSLDKQLFQSKEALRIAQEEVVRIQAEKEKISRENEKLQIDTISYFERNAELQKDKESLSRGLKEAQRVIENKEADKERANKKLEELGRKMAQETTGQQEKMLKEKKELEEKVGALEATLKNERALYHYNLAVSYSQAKLYEEAVAAYEKSLAFSPDNAEAHYNLGLLYADYKNDPQKAVLHYRKYLELRPAAEDKEEVEAWIVKLQ